MFCYFFVWQVRSWRYRIGGEEPRRGYRSAGQRSKAASCSAHHPERRVEPEPLGVQHSRRRRSTRRPGLVPRKGSHWFSTIILILIIDGLYCFSLLISSRRFRWWRSANCRLSIWLAVNATTVRKRAVSGCAKRAASTTHCWRSDRALRSCGRTKWAAPTESCLTAIPK